MGSQKVGDKLSLPIHQHREGILNLIKNNQVTIVQAETGSGKSTQIPQFLLQDYPKSKIVVSQPRRMAAIAVATRVASELTSDLGSLVGFHIKGECKVSNSTQITYMTSGVLIQIISHIPLSTPLPWDFVIMDEVHERSIEMDFLLVVFKYYLSKGKHFKLILMSATMQNILAGYYSPTSLRLLSQKQFLLEKNDLHEQIIDWTVHESEWMPSVMKNNFYKPTVTTISSTVNFTEVKDPLSIFTTDSRKYKIHINYIKDILGHINSKTVLEYLTKAGKESLEISLYDVEFIFKNIQKSDPEEIDQIIFTVAVRLILYYFLAEPDKNNETFLVFLPGIQEISLMFEMLQDYFCDCFESLDIIMLHSSIPEKEHIKVLRPPKEGCRRVILSTNIAESSITLPDVSFVIDFCCSREVYFNPKTMNESLILVWAAKATAQQRAGRSGRVSEGKVCRMITLEFFEGLLEYPRPEMQRSCLDKIILKLKLMEISDPKSILAETVEPPSLEQINSSEDFLKEMGAINLTGKISRLGRMYADMPYDIRVTRLCVFSILFHCVKDAMKIASIISLEKNILTNFSTLRPSESVKHPYTYMQRLIYSKSSDSDLIMYKNIFDVWYKKFGKEVKKTMFKHGHRHLRNVRPSQAERKFCAKNYFEVNSLREALSNYIDIKQRFLDLKLDPWYFKETPQEPSLKLCIAAAFCDRMLVSCYEIYDERMRNREIDMLPNSKSMYISKFSNTISDEDIKGLLSTNKEQPESITVARSCAIIKYPENTNEKTLKMSLWLGNYTRKYLNLAWIVMKQLDNGRRLPMKPNPAFISRVPAEFRKEGSIFNINDRRTGKNIEINFLKRLEYPYKLQHKDILTGEIVKIEEDSVNYSIFTTNLALANSLSLVCTEYSERNKYLLGKNSTVLPPWTFLPYAIILIFTPTAAYLPDHCNKRYLGFTVNSSLRIEFAYLYTHEDALWINDMRNKVSGFVSNIDYFENSGFSMEIVQDIVEFSRKERIPIKSQYPNWEKVINWSCPKFASETSTWESDGFLPPLKLLNLSEDLSYLHFNISTIKSLKTSYITELHTQVETISITECFLVCNFCQQIICPLTKIKQLPGNPIRFSIRAPYGSLVETDNTEPTGFSQFLERNYIVQKWENCNQEHLLGWSDDEGSYISGNSPVQFLLPMMRYEPFNEKMWENNFEQLKRLEMSYLKEFAELKIEKECRICDERFENYDEFSKHVKINDSHGKKEAMFMENYVS